MLLTRLSPRAEIHPRTHGAVFVSFVYLDASGRLEGLSLQPQRVGEKAGGGATGTSRHLLGWWASHRLGRLHEPPPRGCFLQESPSTSVGGDAEADDCCDKVPCKLFYRRFCRVIFPISSCSSSATPYKILTNYLRAVASTCTGLVSPDV